MGFADLESRSEFLKLKVLNSNKKRDITEFQLLDWSSWASSNDAPVAVNMSRDRVLMVDGEVCGMDLIPEFINRKVDNASSRWPQAVYHFEPKGRVGSKFWPSISRISVCRHWSPETYEFSAKLMFGFSKIALTIWWRVVIDICEYEWNFSRVCCTEDWQGWRWVDSEPRTSWRVAP